MNIKRRISALILSALMCLSMTACGNGIPEQQTGAQVTETSETVTAPQPTEEPAPTPTPEPTPEPTPQDPMQVFAFPGNVEITEWDGEKVVKVNYSESWKKAIMAETEKLCPDIFIVAAPENIEFILMEYTVRKVAKAYGVEATGEQVYTIYEENLDVLQSAYRFSLTDPQKYSYAANPYQDDGYAAKKSTYEHPGIQTGRGSYYFPNGMDPDKIFDEFVPGEKVDTDIDIIIQ